MTSPWQGTWSTHFNELRLHQRGNRVYGDYQKVGLIEGTVDSSTNTLEGIYINQGNQGRIRFVLDGDKFTGQWANEDAEPNSPWDGTRTSSAKPTLTSHPFIGTWKTTQGELKLLQEGTRVYGKLNDDIAVEGTFTFSNRSLLGIFQGPNTSGRFQITGDDDRFSGDWETSAPNATQSAWSGERISSAEPNLDSDRSRYRLRVGNWPDAKQLIKALDRANSPLQLTIQDLTDRFRTGGILAANLTRAEAEAIQAVLAEATLNDLMTDIEPMPISPATDGATMAFTIQGRITQNSRAMAGITIRAYDRDLRTEQLLGSATTDTDGRYQIAYTRNQFRRADKTNADLDLRLFNAVGTPIKFAADRSLPRFNADPDEEINITLQANAIVTPSEYENLRLLVDPILEDAQPATLTATEIAFIANDTNIASLDQFPLGVDSLSLLRASDRLSQATAIPTAAFYGWGRFGNTDWNTREDNLQSIDLDPLIATEIATLQRLFVGAIAENWIPQAWRDRWEAIRDRINTLKADKDEQIRQTWDVQVASMRLVNATSKTPLPGYTVRATAAGRVLSPTELGSDITNSDGIVSFAYRLSPELVEANASTPIQFEIFDLQSNGSIAKTPTSTVNLDYTPNLGGYRESRLPVEPREDDDIDSPEPGTDAPQPNALSPNAYLADLIRYIITNFATIDGQPLTLKVLEEDLLYQPLEALPRLIAAASDPIHQNRLALEILQKYLTKNPPSPERQRLLSEAQKEYLHTAYQTLLLRLGTDPDELKRIRYAGEEEQVQLASRLGIRLSDLLSDTQLSSLFIEPADLSLAKLDTLFGLRTPLSNTNPLFLDWQISALKEQWVKSDFPEATSDDRFPIVDPDLLTEATFVGDNAARHLFRIRTQTLQQWLSEVQAQPQTQAGFEALLATLNLTANEITSKYQEAQGGKDITNYLQEKKIRSTEFFYLRNINQLFADSIPVLTSEWQEVYQIVVQFRKRQAFTDWIEAEKSQISLSPDFFQLTDIDLDDRLDTMPALKWRLDLPRSRSWQQTLKARIQQLAALEAELANSVEATASSCLSIWRDGAIAAAGHDHETLDRAAERLSEVLLIDLKISGNQKTTRVAQALKSLQTLCFATRTGQLDTAVIRWQSEDRDFDADWQWMGSYETWKAAMAAYLYPENIVLPTIQAHQSPAYRTLVQQVRDRNSLSSSQARHYAQAYEDYFRDICSLDIKAACEATTGAQATQYTPANTKLVFLVAKSRNSGKYYWSTYNQAIEDGAFKQAPWAEINQEPNVEFVGASPSSYSWDDRRHRHVCLVFKARSREGKNILQLLRFNLQTLQWEEQTNQSPLQKNQRHQNNKIEISLEAIVETGSYSVTVVQENDPWRQTNLRLMILNGNADQLYLCYLSEDANELNISEPVSLPRRWHEILTAVDDPNPQNFASITLVLGFKNENCIVGRYRILARNNVFEASTQLSFSHRDFAGAVVDKENSKIICFNRESKFQSINTIGSYSVDSERSFSPKIDAIATFSGSSNQTFYTLNRDPRIGRFDQSSRKFISENILAPDRITLFEVKALGEGDDTENQRNRIQRQLQAYTANPSNTRVFINEVYHFVPLFLAIQLQQKGQYIAALDWYRTLYNYAEHQTANRGLLSLLKGLSGLFDALRGRGKPLVLDRDWLATALNPHANASQRGGTYFLFALHHLIDCLLDYADAEFTRDTAESLGKARLLYDTALEIIATEKLKFDPKDLKSLALQIDASVPTYTFEISPNITFEFLFQRAVVSLEKLRAGRNIAGIARAVPTYSAPTDAASALAGLSRFNGSPTSLRSTQLRPTQYRYRVLIDRTKELVNLAQQIEAAYLSALQNLDGDNYSLLKARHDMTLAQSGIQLQDLRVQQAEAAVAIARLQRERSQLQMDYYSRLVNNGRLWQENWAIDLLYAAAALQGLAAVGSFFGGGPGAVLSSLSSAASLTSSAFSTEASYIRREQEWRFQRQLANQDIRISQQQIQNTQQSVRIVEQEREISELQLQQADETLNFLSTKNLTAEIYAWMSHVLRRIYSYFLQEATAIAQLAEQQLAFERQVASTGLIRSDYLTTPAEGLSQRPSGNEENNVRLGLTGSAQLLQDIYRLDQLAFTTNQRKLQLTKTISLARLFPIEFAQFRESGVLPFATPMSLFDRDYPGHYLRLIERVRIAVIALIPPTEGIKATLTSVGNAQVVTGDAGFPTVQVNSGAQMVALSSPNNDSGLFELQQPSEFLRPFEKQGVASQWNFELPKASNPFDFNTIADVLLTIEYTALHSEAYKNQILPALDRSAGGDRAFSFRNEFADAWYDLHNPEQTATPGTVKFKPRRADFPPNINDLTLSNVRLYFALKEGTTWPERQAITLSTNNQEGNPVPDKNGIARFPLIQLSAADQEWQLTIPEDAEVQRLFSDNRIDEMLLIVAYDGQLPA